MPERPIVIQTTDERTRRFAQINERTRRAFLEGAAEEWKEANGRAPTEDELGRILVRYPGDPMWPALRSADADQE